MLKDRLIANITEEHKFTERPQVPNSQAQQTKFEGAIFGGFLKSRVTGSRWGEEEVPNPGLMDGCGCNQTRLQNSSLRHLPPLSLEFGSECAPGPHSPSSVPGAPILVERHTT